VTVRPKKRLGQHFLVDRNILDVIDRLAELDHDDIVLEVGPGLGVLTRYLAESVAFVHAVEVDRSLAGPLGDALSGVENVVLAFGDALVLDVSALDPPPTKLVANLPYAIATPLVLELLEHAPALARFVVMVQREVADRFFAEPRTKAYGAVSVLVRLQARRVGFHAVPPTVFRPRPRVESALVALERLAVPPPSDVRPVVDAAFAHRRKTLANSVAGVGLATRSEAEAALAAIGRGPRARAEELDPADFVGLAEALKLA
jgi:16S rRNA (adenine1518-N6/adenine1519-N6)-dimethyltransferase